MTANSSSQQGVTIILQNGSVNVMEQVYLRGAMIRYFVVPDFLIHSPMFGKRGQGKALESEF